MLRGCVGSGDVGDWVGVGVGVMTLFRLNVPVPRSVLGTFVVGLPWSSLICWVGFVGMYVRGWMPFVSIPLLVARGRGSGPKQRVKSSWCSGDATVQQCANYDSLFAVTLGLMARLSSNYNKCGN